MRFATEYCPRYPRTLLSRSVDLREAAANRAASANEYREILCHIPGGSTGIDAAAGLGIGTGLLAARSRQVIGIEISEERLSAARQENEDRGNIIWLRKDLNEIPGLLPLYSEPVDYVVSLQTIEHLFSPALFLMAARAALKTGGLLIVSAPAVQTTDLNPYHLHDFTPNSLKEMVESAGFSITGLQITSSVQPLSWANPFKRAGRVMPNIVPRSLLLKNMAEVYWQNPLKFLRRCYSLASDFGFPRGSVRIEARKE